MTVPIPTPIYRLIHVDNLAIVLRRQGLHAPNHAPDDGLKYRTIHSVEVQEKRHAKAILRGPGGFIHDYVSFYFGPLSPMHLQLKTGQVPGYVEGQEPLIYLTSTVQAVDSKGLPFVFADGHGIAAFTEWYEDVADLGKVDWNMVGERYWRDNESDMDRQRRKQAEFAIYQACPWDVIEQIGVINTAMKERVEIVLAEFNKALHRPVIVRPDWYYY